VPGHAPYTANSHSLQKEAATQAPPPPPLLSAPEARAWLLGPKSIRFPSGSKRRACEKRHQAHGETQSLKGAQASKAAAAAAAKEIQGSPSYSASVSQGTPPSSPAAGTRQEPQGAPATTSRDEGVSCPGSEECAQSQEEKSAGTSQAAPSIPSSCRDPLTRKVRKLVQFLLEKYITKEPIPQAALLKAVNRKYQKHFPQILSRALEIMELVFGLELKDADPSNHSYALISKIALPSEGSPSDESGLPTSGLLMILLGLIFKKGNRATEEQLWQFLNALGFYAGRRHLIFGEPRRLISEDFVQQKYLTYRQSGLLMVLLGMIFTKGNRATEEELWEFLNALGFYAGRRHLIFGEPTRFISKYFVQQKYLTYRQVPNSDPPRYEFLWGPRAHAETSKMKVLEFVANIIGTVPSALPNLYEEALKDEEERARVRVAARAAAVAARGPFIAKIHSCPKCRGVGRGHFAYFVLAGSSKAPK
ncbi:hypothetical protein EI555_005018, partial [Monodon monoceros]